MRYKNIFVQSKMNKDVDERLLPKGQYSHAENIRVSNTDGSDSGAIENVKGNEQLTSFSLTNVKTIGTFADSSNQKIYWFNTSDEKDMIVEYDFTNSQTSVLLESTKPNGVLNFNKGHLITGVVKIINGDYGRDLLVWTDDINPPRMINIERVKTYGVDGFTEDDISLIKKPPRFSPEVQLTFTPTTLENNLENKFLSFSYRYKYLDGEYSALSTFSNYKFSPNQFDLDYQTMENDGMVNSFNALNIVFNTGERQVTDIELVYKESNSNTVYVIETFNKEEEGWSDNELQSFRFSNSKLYTPLPDDELFRQYDNVPKTAKALELIGNRLIFGNYTEGYDLINTFGENVNIDYNVSVINKDLTGQELPVNISSPTSLVVDLTGINLIKNSRLDFNMILNEVTYNNGNFNNNFNFILNKDYLNASDLAQDEDFIFFIESVMTGNFLQNYTALPPDDSEVTGGDGFSIESSTTTSITIGTPTIQYTIDETPFDTGDNPANTRVETSVWNYRTTSGVFFKEIAINSSLKTNRSYEVGLIYMDSYGRCSTVLTDKDNTAYVPQEFSVFQNKLLVNINHIPPVWADRYKLVVKQNKRDYQTIYSNIFYEDGLYRWVKLEGANKNKVKEGETLIVKSDLGGAVSEPIKVRVLEVATKEKDFIEGNQNVDGDDIIEESGLYMKIKPSGFDMNFNSATARTFEGSSHLRYPTNTYTEPEFGEVGATFNPYSLKAGSSVRIFIEFAAFGAIEYKETYDKTFRVSSDYDNVQEWFEAEVEDLGSFGDDFTRDWGFDSEGKRFYVRAHRDGTASRKIYTTVKFEVLFSEGTVIFETEPLDLNNEIYYETEQTFEIINDRHSGNNQDQTNTAPAVVELDFFNCFIQGNGAESYRYKDAFIVGEDEVGVKIPANYLNIDLRPSSTSVEKYKEVRRYADLTYSAPYNENNNINGLNEFNLSLANYKEDIDKKYGYIQKLHSRDNDLIVLQEDKISKVLFGKDLLLNADGTSNISSIEDVLGQQIPYAGEYGISRNPESFVFDGFNVYFTDAKRGAVLRLGLNGLTEISMHGMRQFFKDEFKNYLDAFKIGGFDPYRDQYVLHPSLDLNIPPVNISCGNTLTKENFSGELIVNLDLGLSVGETGITYNVTEGLINIEIIYNNQTIQSLDNLSGSGSFDFDKLISTPSNAVIKITSEECSNFQIVGSCITSTQLNVINLILNDDSDDKLTMKSRYNWSSPEYVSSFKTYDNIFGTGEVATYDNISGAEGVREVPLTGSTVFMESFNGINETSSFEEGDRLGYLISDTLITENNYQDIVDNATFLPITETIYPSGDISNSGSFVFNRPNEETYLYLIWDYVRKNQAPVAVNDTVNASLGQSSTFNIKSNDTDEDNDPLTVIINTNPTNGTLVVNPDNTVTYTHDGGSNLTDSFTYYLNDGNLDSNIATVNINVGVTAGSSISASGSAGVYLIPFITGTEAGDLIVHFDAQGIPDRFQILFDTNGNSNNIEDMEVVADSLFIGDSISSSNPPNGTTSGLNLNQYNGSTFDTLETGTQSIVVTDDVVVVDTGNRTDLVPNGGTRNGSGGIQIGVQDLVYTSVNDNTGTTGLQYSDGNIALKYSKPVSSSFVAYIRAYGLNSTAWNIYKTEFIES